MRKVMPMSEDQVIAAMKAARLDRAQIRAMTYTSWKDGIDIERPCTGIMNFIRLIEAGAPGEKGNADD